MWIHAAKKFKINSCFFHTFSPAYMKLNTSGWEVKIHMLFHVSFPSSKMCVFRHLGRCLTTLCSHQVTALYKKRSDCASWDEVNICVVTHLQSWASFIVFEAASKVKDQDSEKIECFLFTHSLDWSAGKGQGMIWSTATQATILLKCCCPPGIILIYAI